MVNSSLLEMVKLFPALKRGGGIKNTNSKNISVETYFVARLQLELFNQGCVDEDNPFWDSVEAGGIKRDSPSAILKWTDGDFGKWVEEGVKYFQSTHVDWDGNYLETTGIVDQKTWYALYDIYSDRKQPVEVIPEKTAVAKPTSERKTVLDIAFKYKGVVEKPRGSNRSPVIDKFTGGHAWAWCAMFTHYVFKEALNRVYVGQKDKDPKTWQPSPSCWQNRKWAKEVGIWKEKGKVDPEIGDIYSMDYGGGRGHTGFVTGIKKDSTGKIAGVFTLSGNESDSVKEGYRPLSQGSLAGFISPYKVTDRLDKYLGVNTFVVGSGKDKTT